MSDIHHPREIAARLDIGEGTVRRVVRKACDAGTPDELRMIPGGLYDQRYS